MVISCSALSRFITAFLKIFIESVKKAENVENNFITYANCDVYIWVENLHRKCLQPGDVNY